MKHHFAKNQNPSRTVILGAGGFVGGATTERLRSAGADVLALTRSDLDLESSDAGEKLAGLLDPNDVLVFVSAKAPVKNVSMLMANLRMAENVCHALKSQPVAHVVYVSSDAVYSDTSEPLTEESVAEPDSLHGIMHLAREIMLRYTVMAPLAILRSTLIYGACDPHNGYGPNRFRRLATEGKEIVLFGEGEERRDHILVDDVAELICRIVLRRSEGVLNAATGNVNSFREIAEMVVAQFSNQVPIKGSPRSRPMPHNGFRPFNAAATATAFPDFQYTQLKQGLTKVHSESRT